MSFEYEAYLWVVVLVAAVSAAALALEFVRKSRALRDFPRLRSHCRSRTSAVLQGTLLCALILLSGSAALGPRAKVVEEVPVREGMTIIASIDCSLSMLAAARVAKPGEPFETRIDVVLKSVHRLFEVLEYDRKGFACFAGHIFAARAATTDYVRILKPQLEKIDRRYIEIIGKQSSFAQALEGCRRQFDLTDGAHNVCIILSDGEPQGSNENKMRYELMRAINELKATVLLKNLKASFYVVGVGDTTRSERIPRFDKSGNFAGFVVDPSTGQPAVTRPDETYLSDIAAQMGGQFKHVESPDDLLGVLNEIINSERKLIEVKKRIVMRDLSGYFIAAIIFVLALLLLLPARFLPVSYPWET